MRENYRMSYKVDIVFCIDATGSMTPIISMVKNNVLKLYEDVMNAMRARHKVISGMRVRIVAFRDYYADGEEAMLMSDFFNLPEEETDLKECVDSIEAEGGGDIPEDGLEALAYAMKSDWVKDGVKRRHVIVMCSDAPAHEIGYAVNSKYYPKGMPASFDALSDWWGDPACEGVMEENAKRLVIFAPSDQECDCDGQWEKLAANWNNVIYIPSNAGEGLEGLEYEQVLATIANTI